MHYSHVMKLMNPSWLKSENTVTCEKCGDTKQLSTIQMNHFRARGNRCPFCWKVEKKNREKGAN